MASKIERFEWMLTKYTLATRLPMYALAVGLVAGLVLFLNVYGSTGVVEETGFFVAFMLSAMLSMYFLVAGILFVFGQAPLTLDQMQFVREQNWNPVAAEKLQEKVCAMPEGQFLKARQLWAVCRTHRDVGQATMRTVAQHRAQLLAEFEKEQRVRAQRALHEYLCQKGVCKG